jgi:hypothetical protein
MAAGGNDALMHHGIPGFSPHALPAYLAMIAGIAIVLTLSRLLRGIFTRVEIRDDILETSIVRRWRGPYPVIPTHPPGFRTTASGHRDHRFATGP